MAMDVAKHYAKPDPGNFQARLLKDYEDRISRILVAPQSLLAN
jgi:hypothetical protein